MQDHARRIRLRHMMHSIIAGSEVPLPLDEIVVQLVGEFRRNSGLLDALLPELTADEAPTIFNFTNHTKWVPVRNALRYMVLREFTTGVRRTDCLESMGLAQVAYQGFSPQLQAIQDLSQTLGISSEEVVEGISLILDNWRRSRIVYVQDDPIYSRFHAKDDPYIQQGLLPLKDFRPEGLAGEDRSIESLLTRRDLRAGRVSGAGTPEEVGL